MNGARPSSRLPRGASSSVGRLPPGTSPWCQRSRSRAAKKSLSKLRELPVDEDASGTVPRMPPKRNQKKGGSSQASRTASKVASKVPSRQDTPVPGTPASEPAKPVWQGETVVGINFGQTASSIAVINKVRPKATASASQLGADAAALGIAQEGLADCIANDDGDRQIATAVSFAGDQVVRPISCQLHKHDAHQGTSTSETRLGSSSSATTKTPCLGFEMCSARRASFLTDRRQCHG